MENVDVARTERHVGPLIDEQRRSQGPANTVKLNEKSKNNIRIELRKGHGYQRQPEERYPEVSKGCLGNRLYSGGRSGSS